MNIAIINVCKPDPTLDHHGSVGFLIQQWLAPHLPEANLPEIHVAAGHALPEISDFDGFIISGSEMGVYDKTDWMEPLKTFLQALRDQRVPVFGICFGHQIMAEAYGGRAEKIDGGYEIGVRQYTQKPDSVADDQPPQETLFAAHAMHQDQVVSIPPSARVTAKAPYCPVAALDYQFPARSLQFHPEYSTQFVAEAIDMFEGKIISETEATQSRGSLDEFNVSYDLCGKETATFFRDNTQPS